MSPWGNVPITAAAFPFWTAIPSLCLRNAKERESPVWVAIRPPMSAQVERAEGPQAPSVSIAIGAKIKSPEATNSAYLVCLRASALSAADPAACMGEDKCEGAKVSGHVKSQIKYWPLCQGSRVAPSGLFKSLRSRRGGSSSAWVSTERMDLRMTSFARECRLWRPALRRQERPWWPNWSTSVPQISRGSKYDLGHPR